MHKIASKAKPNSNKANSNNKTTADKKWIDRQKKKEKSHAVWYPA
jgi:hypothetical protein